MAIQQHILIAADTIAENPRAEVLLIRRKNPPFQGMWAFPGGFVEDDEDLSEAAARELEEETGVVVAPEQLWPVGTYGKPGRDPRGRTVSVVFAVLLEREITAVAADDAAEARWFALNALPPMAFDHGQIMQDYLRLRSRSPQSEQSVP